jgi:hypothetical protein
VNRRDSRPARLLSRRLAYQTWSFVRPASTFGV